MDTAPGQLAVCKHCKDQDPPALLVQDRQLLHVQQEHVTTLES